MKTSEARKKANAKWASKNREHRNYLTKRSNARGFIRNNATQEDLLELREMIDEKLSEMKEV